MVLKLEEVNYRKLYVYDLDNEIRSSLSTVYFDRSAKVAHRPQKLQSRDSIIGHIVYPGMSTKLREQAVDDGASKEGKSKSGIVGADKRLVENLQDAVDDLDLVSDSESDEEIFDTYEVSYLNSRSPYVYLDSCVELKSEMLRLTVYKCLFSALELKSPVKSLQNYTVAENDVSAIFMIGGGHFVAAIVSHKPKHIRNFIKASETEEILPQTVDLVAHKTSHRYTTRRKQGGSQSAMDNAKGKANSAGSTLRRYNEQALAQEVTATIEEWKDHLVKCKSIFIKANNSKNFNSIVAGEASRQSDAKKFKLYKDDVRIKKFPFTTSKFTIQELKMAWCRLTYLFPHELPQVDTKIEDEKKRLEQLEASKQQKQLSKPKTDPLETHTHAVTVLLKKSKAPALVQYLKENKLSADFHLSPTAKYRSTPTMLHYACENGLDFMVYTLLVTLKADPTLGEKRPFEFVKDRATIQSFQRARGKLGEDYCDWKKDAKMTAPAIGEEEYQTTRVKEKQAKEEEQRAESEKKERMKKQDKNLTKFKPSASVERELLGSMSPEQRRRIEREKRARAAEARFKNMG